MIVDIHLPRFTNISRVSVDLIDIFYPKPLPPYDVLLAADVVYIEDTFPLLIDMLSSAHCSHYSPAVVQVQI